MKTLLRVLAVITALVASPVVGQDARPARMNESGGLPAGVTYTETPKEMEVAGGTLSATNLEAVAYPTPGAVTISNEGTPGSTTVSYVLVWKAPNGETTEAGALSTTTTSAATLDATNFNRLSWSAGPTGATAVIYRTVAPTTPATVGIIYTGTALTVDDTGLAGGGETAPTTNGTGVVTANEVNVGNGALILKRMPGAVGTDVLFAGASTYDGIGFGSSATNYSLRGISVKLVALGGSYGATAGSIQSGGHSSTLLLGPSAATLQLGAAASATPVAQTLQAQGGSGTDIPGANLTIQSGAGTSDATGSSLIFKTPADSGSTGTTPQTQVARVTIKELHINLRLGDIAIYANNAAALAGGLVAGDLYRTGADPDPVMIVH